MKNLIDINDYSSKSEIANDLIRLARWEEWLVSKLTKAENSGFKDMSSNEILRISKSQLKNGLISNAMMKLTLSCWRNFGLL